MRDVQKTPSAYDIKSYTEFGGCGVSAIDISHDPITVPINHCSLTTDRAQTAFVYIEDRQGFNDGTLLSCINTVYWH